MRGCLWIEEEYCSEGWVEESAYLSRTGTVVTPNAFFLGCLGGPCLPRDRTRASSMQSRTPACLAIYHTQEIFPLVTLLLNWGLLAWTHARHTPILGSSLYYICLRPMERKVRDYTLFQMPISQSDIGLSSFCATEKSILSLLHSLRPWRLRDIFDYSPDLA